MITDVDVFCLRDIIGYNIVKISSNTSFRRLIFTSNYIGSTVDYGDLFSWYWRLI